MAISTVPKFTSPSEVGPIFTVIGHSSPSITCSANSAPTAVSFDVTRNDLGTPIGVVGINTNNPNLLPMIFTITRPSADTYAVQLKLRNVASTAQTTNAVFVNVVYVQHGATVVY